MCAPSPIGGFHRLFVISSLIDTNEAAIHPAHNAEVRLALRTFHSLVLQYRSRLGTGQCR
jgi:hypothetical protein